MLFKHSESSSCRLISSSCRHASHAQMHADFKGPNPGPYCGLVISFPAILLILVMFTFCEHLVISFDSFLAVLLRVTRFVGRISAKSRVTPRWHIFSKVAVTFSCSNFGTFSRGRLHFWTPPPSPPSPLPPPPKKVYFGKVQVWRSTENVSLEAFSRIFVWQLSRLATKRLWLASFEGMTTTPMSWLQKGKAPNRPDGSESSVWGSLRCVRC